MFDFKSQNTNSIDYYLVYIISLIFCYLFVLLAVQIIKGILNGSLSEQSRHNGYNISLLNVEQRKLRFRFLLVSTAIKAAIWVKAPYVFALYNRLHGFTRGDIGILYAIDNLSALIMGPVMGSLGDIYGRKKFCIFYCALVVTHISIRLTGSQPLAYFAQFLTGLAGALVDTAFESWLNFEANAIFSEEPDQRHLKHLFLREIFSRQVNIDCYTSIILTSIASMLYIKYGLSYPFYACIFFVSLAGLFILMFWRENDTEELKQIKSFKLKAEVGSTDSLPENYNNYPHSSFWEKLKLSWDCIRADKALFCVGVIESCFRITLQLFVFIWTPILEETIGGLIHPGSVFVCFMISRLVGSEMFEFFKMVFHTNSYLVSFFISFTACIAYFITYSFKIFSVRLLMFVYFDGLAGIFNPLFSSLKSQMIPEKLRNTVMNFFRIPINMFSIFTLVGTNYLTTYQICLIAFGFMLVASIVNVYLLCIHDPPDKKDFHLQFGHLHYRNQSHNSDCK